MTEQFFQGITVGIAIGIIIAALIDHYYHAKPRKNK